MARRFALAALAILLLTAGAIFLVNRLTDDAEPSRSAAERARADAAAGAGAEASAQPAAPWEPSAQQPRADFSAQDPGSTVVIPARPQPTGAVPNESPPIQGPTAVPLPVDREERGEMLMRIRRERAGQQLDRINQRNRERAGLLPGQDAPSQPQPAPPQP